MTAGTQAHPWTRDGSRGSAQVLLGSPSVNTCRPTRARALMNHMRSAWGIADPRVQLLVDPACGPPAPGGGAQAERAAADPAWDVQRRRLLWYLPHGRSIVLMPEDWRLEDMTPLEQLAGQAPGGG